MDLGLQGRTVVVTGVSGGMGREIAAAFGAEGATVVGTYARSRDEAESLLAPLGERGVVVEHDLADPASADHLVATALDRTGRVDVLVNNALIWGDPTARFEDVPDDAWTGALRANIEGAIRLSRAVAPTLRKQRWGRLVHLSSTLVVDGADGSEYYTAAKAALHGFSRSLAHSLGKDGDILSNVVVPGLTRTATNPHVIDAAGELYAARTPIGRLLDAAEVARPVVFLASAANTGITGQAVPVSGGQ